MSFQEARQMRKMPFLRRGLRADMDGKAGRITSAKSAHLRIRYDGAKHSVFIHPTWHMTYYQEDGTVLKDETHEKETHDHDPRT